MIHESELDISALKAVVCRHAQVGVISQADATQLLGIEDAARLQGELLAIEKEWLLALIASDET